MAVDETYVWESVTETQEEKLTRPLDANPTTGEVDTAVGTKNILALVREAGWAKGPVLIRYRKPDGTIRNYMVAPYSIKRLHRRKGGEEQVLFAYHFVAKTIKRFSVEGLLRARRVEGTFVPKWKAEFGGE